jgi:hypothetical protein
MATRMFTHIKVDAQHCIQALSLKSDTVIPEKNLDETSDYGSRILAAMFLYLRFR